MRQRRTHIRASVVRHVCTKGLSVQLAVTDTPCRLNCTVCGFLVQALISHSTIVNQARTLSSLGLGVCLALMRGSHAACHHLIASGDAEGLIGCLIILLMNYPLEGFERGESAGPFSLVHPARMADFPPSYRWEPVPHSENSPVMVCVSGYPSPLPRSPPSHARPLGALTHAAVGPLLRGFARKCYRVWRLRLPVLQRRQRVRTWCVALYRPPVCGCAALCH